MSHILSFLDHIYKTNHHIYICFLKRQICGDCNLNQLVLPNLHHTSVYSYEETNLSKAQLRESDCAR